MLKYVKIGTTYLVVLICCISLVYKLNDMKTTVLNTQHIKVEVSIIDGMVFITNTYNNTKRTTSFESVEAAINGTTMPPVKNYLMGLN